MRASTPALRAYLAARLPWPSADLFTITLLSGSVLRLTSADIAISYGGLTWQSYGPTISRSSWGMTNSPDVPEMQIVIASTGDDYQGSNIKALVHQGLFDGATILLERAVMPAPGDTSLGTVVLFSGRASAVEIDGLHINITVKALSTILQQFMPRNIYTAGCSWALYSSGCTLSRAAHTATNTAAAASSKNIINLTGSWTLPDTTHPAPADLILGSITITSGPGAGQVRTIVDAASGWVKVGYPLVTLPTAGDAVTAVVGCNKTKTRCAALGNSQNYRGFDFIPPAETAY